LPLAWRDGYRRGGKSFDFSCAIAAASRASANSGDTPQMDRVVGNRNSENPNDLCVRLTELLETATSTLLTIGMAHSELRGLSTADATTSNDHQRLDPASRPQTNQRRMNMNTLITTTARRTLTRSLAAGLAVAAMTILAGATAAQAVDQQATDPARDDAANHRAAERGYGYSAAPRYPSGAFARAPGHIRDRGDAVPPPELDFQLQGRP
jgi:hypothetical protein